MSQFIQKSSKIALAALFLSLTSTAFAQEESSSLKDINGGTTSTSIKVEEPMQKPKASRITPEFSVMSSTFVGSDSGSASSITKISIGGMIDIGESNLVTETGIIYRQIGANETSTAQTGSVGVETDLNYLTVPVAEKYYFSNQRESSFYAKVGLAPSLLVGNQLIETTHGPSVRNESPNAFAIDALIGLGGKYQLTEQLGIVLEVSYWRGLTPVFSGSNIYTSNFVNTLGFNINL